MALHLSIEVFPSFTHIHNYQICVPFFVFFFFGGARLRQPLSPLTVTMRGKNIMPE